LFENFGGGFIVAIFVVPIPPLVRRCLRITFWRVLPFLLAPERSDVEIVPRAPHLFVATIVDEVRTKHAVAIANERIGAVPFIYTKIPIEVIRDRVPRNELPAHACF